MTASRRQALGLAAAALVLASAPGALAAVIDAIRRNLQPRT